MSARRAPQCAERPAGSLRSSLARHLPARPADEPQLLAMRRAAWLKEGIAVIRPADLDDDWLRQTVINAATKLYGARRPEGGRARSRPRSKPRSRPKSAGGWRGMAKRRGKKARKDSGAAELHESLAPTRERRRQGPVEDAGTLSDARGQIGAPYRAIDTLERMTRAGTISAEQRNAGERFREDFARAHLEPLTVPRLDRIPGQHTPLDTSYTVIGAREAVHRALLTLGGMTTPVAEVAWAILGEGRTLKEWCALRPWSRNGRGMKPETASGILIAALSLLANHYGLTRRGR